MNIIENCYSNLIQIWIGIVIDHLATHISSVTFLKMQMRGHKKH